MIPEDDEEVEKAQNKRGTNVLMRCISSDNVDLAILRAKLAQKNNGNLGALLSKP